MLLDKLLEDRNRLFWLLNFGGWSAYGITSYLAGIYWGEEWGMPLYRTVCSLTGFVISAGLRALYQRIWHKPLKTQIIMAVIGSYLSAALLSVVINPVAWHFYSDLYTGEHHLLHYFKGVSYTFYIFICWSGLYFGFKFYEGMQQAIQRAIRANALAHEAQLKMLRYQLNPHFLFNTLNAISTLILEKNNTVANDMVSRLSNFLRYSLDNDPMQKTTLAQEINALKLYLDIEEVRFEERLTLEFDLEEAALDGLIPSLLLQPLVENAIKYAVAKAERGGTIAIRARVFARELLLEICDDGPGIPGLEANADTQTSSNGRGVGMRNTRERLRELYGDDHSFHINNVQPCGLQISIRIPFQTDARAKMATTEIGLARE